jgi:hypothetical protein
LVLRLWRVIGWWAKGWYCSGLWWEKLDSRLGRGWEGVSVTAEMAWKEGWRRSEGWREREAVVEAGSELSSKNLGEVGPIWVLHWKESGDCGIWLWLLLLPPQTLYLRAYEARLRRFWRFLKRMKKKAAAIRRMMTTTEIMAAMMPGGKPLDPLLGVPVGDATAGSTMPIAVGEKTLPLSPRT